ncbi:MULTISPECIES: hypothetical protein [unclassified Fibrobacter]|nr:MULTISPECIES: hypothetical protein [unclassified Fibrobacter]
MNKIFGQNIAADARIAANAAMAKAASPAAARAIVGLSRETKVCKA